MKNINKIRLSSNYVDCIKKLAKDIFNAAEIRIFGSRTDLSRRGGDIDIFIKTSVNKNILDLKIRFLRELKKKIGYQKIDVIVKSDISKDKRIFDIAENEGVKI